MNSCEFKEIIVFKDFEVEKGLLGLDRDCYLSIVKFLDSSILRKSMSKYFLFFNFLFVFFVVHWHHTHEWNTFTSWFIDWKVLLIFITIIIILLIHFIIICIYLEVKFIEPLDYVKIQRKKITFTRDGCYRTIFINKMINSGIMRMFISLL
jgi:hypothetical protein